jgi:hypothetical protein
MTQPDKRCGTCKWWDDGRCRRYPPQIVVSRRADGEATISHYFPNAFDNQWCGEWTPKEESHE